MSDSTASVSEQPAEGTSDDAFGSLTTARPASDGADLPAREAVEPAAPVVTKEEKLKKLIPTEHRESFAHSATWWQNNIEIFKHHTTGRYLYLSKEAENETNVHAYQYTANGHRFVEVPMEAAIAFATMSEKVAEKKHY